MLHLNLQNYKIISKMRQSLISLSALFLFSICIRCSTAPKISKKNLDNRIAVLEAENKNLHKEIRVMKSQIRDLLNNLPKPSKNKTDRSYTPEKENIATNTATVKFDNTNFDFGIIKTGASVSHTFKFTNTGNFPLKITNAKASCGCTVPKWPKELIKPGEDGEILVTFNSKGKKGNQHKSVTITANTIPSTISLYIKATIKE